ncbi:hypothetical protein, partial [Streptomyces sp. NPDC005547]|uniref:hypothetical protein n=1 Tax=Streptomyces sp. NPDC005547 TaxID=3154887 RepID=UPI0033B3A4C8
MRTAGPFRRSAQTVRDLRSGPVPVWRAASPGVHSGAWIVGPLPAAFDRSVPHPGPQAPPAVDPQFLAQQQHLAVVGGEVAAPQPLVPGTVGLLLLQVGAIDARLAPFDHIAQLCCFLIFHQAPNHLAHEVLLAVPYGKTAIHPPHFFIPRTFLKSAEDFAYPLVKPPSGLPRTRRPEGMCGTSTDGTTAAAPAGPSWLEPPNVISDGTRQG